MTVRRFVKTVTVSAGGAAEVYTPKVYGFLHAVRYVKTDFDNAVDFVITGETSGQTLWSEENVTATASRQPRDAIHSTAGVAALYAADGEAVRDRIPIANERIKIVIANGGVSKTGTFHFYVDDRRDTNFLLGGSEMRKSTVNLVTSSGGAVTAYTPYLSGFIEKIAYRKTDFANGVDFAITDDVTGESILALTDQNAAGAWSPRAATHSNAGVASLYAAGGTAVLGKIPIGRSRVKIVIAQGGDTKSGAVDVYTSG